MKYKNSHTSQKMGRYVVDHLTHHIIYLFRNNCPTYNCNWKMLFLLSQPFSTCLQPLSSHHCIGPKIQDLLINCYLLDVMWKISWNVIYTYILMRMLKGKQRNILIVWRSFTTIHQLMLSWMYIGFNSDISLKWRLSM